MVDTLVTETEGKRRCTLRTYTIGTGARDCAQWETVEQAKDMRMSAAAVWRRDPALSRAQGDSLRRLAEGLRALGVAPT